MLDAFRRHYEGISDVDHVATFLREWLSGPGERVCGALLSTASVEPPDSSGRSFIVGRLVLLDEKAQPRPTHRYPTVRLEDAWIERSELEPFVRALFDGSRPAAIPEVFHSPSIEHLLSANTAGKQTDYAETQIRVTSKSGRVAPEWLPAVANGLPPFLTWAQAVSAWVLNRVAKYGADIREGGQLMMILPDYRAQACALEAGGEEGPRVRVEARSTVGDLALHYIYSREIMPLAGGAVPFATTGLVQLPNCPDATQLDVFCVSAKHGVISHSAFGWSELRAAGVGTRAQDQEIHSEIAGGECETVEFKPFTADTEKTREIVRCLVAFLNTDGGRVYVGIDNNGRPQGRDALKPFRSSADRDGLPTVVDNLRLLVADKIQPVPDYSVFTAEVAGEPIAVVEVPPGSVVHSTTEDNLVVVRRGSTNRRPDLAEFQQLLNSRAGAPSPR